MDMCVLKSLLYNICRYLKELFIVGYFKLHYSVCVIIFEYEYDTFRLSDLNRIRNV